MVCSSGQTVLTRDDRGLAAGRRAPAGRSERRHRPLVAAAGVCPGRTCRPQPRVPDGAAPRPAGDGGVGCRRRRRQGRPWAGFPCDAANEHTPAARACTACWGRGGEARGRAVTAACSLQAPRGLCPAPVPRITSGLYPARSCWARGGRGLSSGWNRAATLEPGQPRAGAARPRAHGQEPVALEQTLSEAQQPRAGPASRPVCACPFPRGPQQRGLGHTPHATPGLVRTTGLQALPQGACPPHPVPQEGQTWGAGPSRKGTRPVLSAEKAGGLRPRPGTLAPSCQPHPSSAASHQKPF